jgi:hypothetical protein
MSEINLLPCPFCGGEADPKEVAYTRSDDDHQMTHYNPGCGECGAEAKSVDVWNTRNFKPQEDN